MADASRVMAGITRAPGISYAVLTPNMKGYEGARAARADEVAIFASASEGFSKANLNATIAEVSERFAPVAKAARADGIAVRGYVSVVTDCPMTGRRRPPMSPAWPPRCAIWAAMKSALATRSGRAAPKPSTPCWPPC